MDTIKDKNLSVLPAPHSYQLKLLTTCAILYGSLTFVCALGFFSPALEELRKKYDTTIEDISFVFTIVLASYCLGALTSGFIYKWINRQLGAIICFIGIALPMFLTPYCPSITIFFVIGGILGYFVGAYDTNQVVWIIELWQSKSGPFLHAQTFCCALGNNIPPLLIAYFLSEDKDTNDNLIFPNKLANSTLENKKFLPTLNPEIYEPKIQIPFAISGTLNALAAVFHIFLFIFYRYYKPPLEDEVVDNFGLKEIAPLKNDQIVEKSESNPQSTNKSWLYVKWPRLRLIILFALFNGVYQGMEMGTMQFIPTFGQYSDLKLSTSESALAFSGLTASFAVGRFLGIFIILKVTPTLMLCGNFTLIMIANLILLIWGSGNLSMLWVGCILLGLGMSVGYATLCDYISKRLVFTDTVGCTTIVGGSIFASIYPLIVGSNIEKNAVVLIYVNLTCIGVCTLFLGGTYFVTKGKRRV